MVTDVQLVWRLRYGNQTWSAPEQISAMPRATMKDIMQTRGQPKLTATAPP